MGRQERIAFYHHLLQELNMEDTEEHRDTFYVSFGFATRGMLRGEGLEDLKREIRDNFIDMTNDEHEVPILI